MKTNQQPLHSNQCYKISQADINSKLTIGLGWDVAQEAEDIDLDASCTMLKNDGSYEIIYYNHLISQNESVQHLGDNLTGAGEGDDEQIVVYLKKIPKDVKQLIFAVNIYSPYTREQHFGMLSNTFIRITNRQNHEILRHTLNQDHNEKTIVLFATLKRYKKRHQSGWILQALGLSERHHKSTLEHKINSVENSTELAESVSELILFLFIIFCWFFITAVMSQFIPIQWALAGGLLGAGGLGIMRSDTSKCAKQDHHKLDGLHKKQGDFIAQTVLKILKSNKRG